MSDRRRIAEKLRARGVKQPYVVVDEARRANILIASALAMLEMETGIPQRNIFGGDYGPSYKGRPPFYHDEVTAARVKALLAQPLNNGVGFTQLTYRPFVVAAEQAGGAHIPRFQMRIGFKILRQLFDEHGSLQLMFERYNGSGAAAQEYGRRAVRLRTKWLGVTGE